MLTDGNNVITFVEYSSKQLFILCHLSDSEKIFELEYVVLSGALSLNRAQLQATPPSDVANGLGSQTSCIVFTGCCLEESKLRDWLRGCARQVKLKLMLIDLEGTAIIRKM